MFGRIFNFCKERNIRGGQGLTPQKGIVRPNPPPTPPMTRFKPELNTWTRQEYFYKKFANFIDKTHGTVPSNTRDCFYIFFWNEEWVPKLSEYTHFDKLIRTEINRKGLLECWRL